MNQPYGRIDITGTFSLPEGAALAEAPEERKFPWKWVIVIGLGLLLAWSLAAKEAEEKR